MAVKKYAKSTYDLNSTDWLPIIAPINCNGFGLRSFAGITFYIRTDIADANTQDTVANGAQESVNSALTFVHKMGLTSRFVQGEVICYAKSAVAHDQVIGTFVL